MTDIAELNLNLARGLPVRRPSMSSSISVVWTPGLGSWPRNRGAGCRCFITRQQSSTARCQSFACWRWWPSRQAIESLVILERGRKHGEFCKYQDVSTNPQ